MDIPNIKPKLKKTSSVEPLKYERKRRASSVRLLQHAGKGEGERVFAENTGIAEIIDKMLKNKEDYAIQLNGCKIMGSFAQHASLEVIVARPKGITLLVDAMSQFVDKLEIQSAAIESLSKFAEGHSPEICCMHIISSGGLSALWQAMKRFPEENNLHFMSLKCVCSMSIHENLAEEVGSEKNINNILSEMESKQYLPGILHTCLLIIANICIEESTTDSLISKNVLDIIISTISSSNNSDIIEAGCRIIGSMAFHDSLCRKVMIPGALDVILKCFDISIENPSSAEVGCWAAASITKDSSNCMEFVAKSGLSKIRNTMRIHDKNSMIQQYGCWTISNIAVEVDDANVKQELLETSTVNILLDAVERFPDNEELQEETIFALGLVMSYTDLQITLYQMEGIRVVIAALKNFPENAVVQEHGCRILGDLAVVEIARKGIQQDDGIAVVVAAMHKFPANTYILEYACQTLANLAAEVPENKSSIAEEGGIEAILNAMRNHADNRMIQLAGCRSLFNLSENDMISIKVIEEGGIQLVFKAMKNYPDDETIQDLGNHALLILAGAIERNSTIGMPGTEDNIKYIISIMESDIDKRNLVSLSCRLIQGHCVEVYNHEKLVRFGAVPAVLTVMKRYLDIPLIQESGCKVLALLSYGDAKSTVISEGGTDMIFSAMSSFQDNQNLQLICCGALAQIVKEEKDQNRKNEWVRFLVKDMKNFPKNEEMQIVGCLMISELTILAGEYHRDLIVGSIEVVLSAIENYPYNMDLQLFACNALGVLAIADDVREQMVEKGAYDFILKAMKEFPKDPEIQKTGCHSLEKLSERDRWCWHETNYDAIKICKDLLKRYADNEIVYREAKNLLYKIEEIAV